MSITSDVPRWQDLLDDLAKKHGVPGASLGVLVDGEVTTVVTGVTSVDTRAPVGVDTLFQVGSTTKSYTATLIMQLVDEGSLELDQPAVDVIPDLRFGPDEEGRGVTIRQLLAHTSGLVGDDFGDFPTSDSWGRGEEAIERFVAQACPNLPRLAPPGHTMSYNNAGYIVLGRIIEILRGKPFARAMKEHLLVPLGATRSATLPEEAIMHSVALGHTPDPENLETPVVAPMWQLPTAYAPPGALLCATATDVLRFARLHLDGGVAEDGTRLLSPESVAVMREQEIEVPAPNALNVDGWGLGFFLFGWSGQRGFGHNGDTIGQHCEFRMFPWKGIALVLLVNGGLKANEFADEVTNEVLEEIADISVPELPVEPSDAAQDLSRFVGTFSTPLILIETKVRDDRLLIDLSPQGAAAALSTLPPLEEVELMPLGDGAFALDIMGILRTPLVFYDPDETGRARYVHLGVRAVPRTD